MIDDGLTDAQYEEYQAIANKHDVKAVKNRKGRPAGSKNLTPEERLARKALVRPGVFGRPRKDLFYKKGKENFKQWPIWCLPEFFDYYKNDEFKLWVQDLILLWEIKEGLRVRMPWEEANYPNAPLLEFINQNM